MKHSPWPLLAAAWRSRAVAAAVPLILVNLVAFAGQLAFLRAHLPWGLPGQILTAVTLESVAVFLALHAHVAALANDSALRLRLGSYGFAAAIGAMNYSHYAAPGWRPTFPAVAVGLMSASSPWLWGVHSRRVSRDALMERGLIEPHALRLGVTRWTWHPVRSARVMYAATWAGVTDPQEAVTVWNSERAKSAAASEVNEINAPAPGTALGEQPPRPARSRAKSAPVPGWRTVFAPEVEAGTLPSDRQVRDRMRVGGARAAEIRREMAAAGLNHAR